MVETDGASSPAIPATSNDVTRLFITAEETIVCQLRALPIENIDLITSNQAHTP